MTHLPGPEGRNIHKLTNISEQVYYNGRAEQMRDLLPSSDVVKRS